MMESDETSNRKISRNESTVFSSLEMSPEIWGKFPDDLIEMVRARLPVATFFRFLKVNKKWNSILTSHTFRERYAQIPITQPWFYTINHINANKAAMYDPSSKKWHHPKIHSLRQKLVIFPIASVDGIVCFVNINHTRFFVGNPLTQTLKELPAMSNIVLSRVVVGMWMNGKSSVEGYKIICINGQGLYVIYDSIKNTWYEPGVMPTMRMLPLYLSLRSQAISIDGNLYFMCSNPEGIISYNMLSGVWNHFLVPNPDVLMAHRILLECGGRIMLVGSMVSDIESCVSVCIWELQKMMLLWKEVDRMPSELCLKSDGKNTQMVCMGSKDLILLSLGSEKMNKLITYDVFKKEWLEVSGYIFPQRGKAHLRFVHGIAFYPCITAIA
ncbi:F-box only protein 6-like [Impatiens glandulifera]|uniref:F-box only protein 6-like n=1 Tax=Impatiens glandulifera TaxID=253017 RepID=UPI001FB151C5|nr:F-box only protein 6-like [Impatiens glandulifera]